MATQLLFLPQIAFASGVFAPGARARFFLSGTTTPVTVYLDTDYSTAAPSPLVADSTGRFPQVFYNGLDSVRCTITAATEASIADIDPVGVAFGSEAALSDDQDFDDVATLLADTSLTYTLGRAGTVTTGQIVQTRAEEFSYEVAASGATDAHVTTAGGVKLYVLPTGDGYNVLAFGADATGVTDSTTAIQKAIDVVKAIVHAGSGAEGFGGGGIVFFPEGQFSVDWLDVSARVDGVFQLDFKPTITLRGSGIRATRIMGNTSDRNIIDALGRNFLRIEHLTISTKNGVTAKTGLLLARETGVAQNCNNGQFTQLGIEGTFSVACCYSIASESNRWWGCRFENLATTGSKRNFYTSTDNVLSVTSDTGGVIFAISANTDNRMFGCEFYNVQNGCSPVHFVIGASYHMFGCLIVTGTRTGTVRLVTYGANSTGVFNGLVSWNDCHFEGGGAGVTAHYFDCDGILTQFHNVNLLGGTYVLSGGAKYMIDYDRDGDGQADLRAFVATPPRLTTALEFHARSLSFSSVDLRTTQFSITAVVSDLLLSSNLNANTILDAATYTNCRNESFGSAIPTSGSYAVGHIVWQSAPTLNVAQGFVCRTAGTFGTLNGGSTTGSITSGSKTLTVNDATGLSEGHFIAIVGVGGFRKVIRIDGTTVTLASASNATVSGAAVSFSTPVFEPLPAIYGGDLFGNATWNPPSIANGASATTDITVTGAVLGDEAYATTSSSGAGLTFTAAVVAVDTVRVRATNNTGGSIDLGSSTIYARVRSRT